MDSPAYVSLSRQAGLKRQFDTLANNIANINTSGYRREGVLFAEHVKALKANDPSLSIASLNRHFIDFEAGDVKTTGNPLDVAIEGDGFFLIESEGGPRLTRAGAFSLNAEGEMITKTGARVLDEGGGAIAVPPQAGAITITGDGMVSAGGQPVGRIGVVTADPATLARIGDTLFEATEGYEPVAEPRLRQHALEGSNVSPVSEIAQLIEVQRAYEQGQKFLQAEDERIKRVVRELGQAR